MFTRPANEKSINTRPSSEKSLHTRPTSEKSQHVRSAKEGSRQVTRENRRIYAEPRTTELQRERKMAGENRMHRWRERNSTPTYRERNHVVEDIGHHEHVYVDHHHDVCRTSVWPSYSFALYYGWGSHYAWSYCYPYYHRRYVFVSLGGYWPWDYCYRRYYWYGCHPYHWYGYYPIAREVVGDTHNYYTYNYYYDDNPVVAAGDTAYDVGVVDHTTFADVRERMAQQALEPAEPTLADRYFEDAIGAFELNNYDRAAELFAQAMELAPDDMILPFAYCQALFAGERYTEAAAILRAALAKVTPEEEGVFYPRGLYSKDDILFEQMNQLAEKAELYSFDGDLQLLMGYNLLGIGELDEAVEPLRLATLDLENAPAATVLLNLLEKLRLEKAVKTK